MNKAEFFDQSHDDDWASRDYRNDEHHKLNHYLQNAIDKSHRGFGTPASYGLLSIDHDMYNPDTPDYRFNPEKARSLIEKMGYLKGSNGFYQKDGNPLKVELLSSNITPTKSVLVKIT